MGYVELWGLGFPNIADPILGVGLVIVVKHEPIYLYIYIYIYIYVCNTGMIQGQIGGIRNSTGVYLLKPYYRGLNKTNTSCRSTIPYI